MGKGTSHIQCTNQIFVLLSVLQEVLAQTYLYVYNPQHLFAYPADAAVVDIHEKESSVLGCKPTHPDIEISFYDQYNNQIREKYQTCVQQKLPQMKKTNAVEND